MTRTLLLAALAACAPAPDDATLDEGSPLSACLLNGGELFATTEIALDVTPVTALAVADDGDLVLGELGGAVSVARMGHDFEQVWVLPATGHPVRSVSLSSDQRLVVTADQVGQVSVWERHPLDAPLLWEQVREEPLRDVAVTVDGRLAWVDAAYSGTPSLWAPPAAQPEVASTTLWNAWTTSFFDEDRQWLVAGDWYGLPQVEVHQVGDLDAAPLSWLDHTHPAGTITVAAARDDGTVAFAGPVAFGDDGFLGLVTPGTEDAQVHFVEGHRPRHGALLPGGEVLLTVGEEGRLFAWALATGEALASHEAPDYRDLAGTDGLGVAELAAPLVAHPDGEHLLLGDFGGVRVVGCR